MNTRNKRKLKRYVKIAFAFVCLLGVVTYSLSDGVLAASDSKDSSLLSGFEKSEDGLLLPESLRIEEEADFEGKAPLRITFDSNQFVGPMESYLWNFGDGEMAQGAVASHTFTSAGTYSVSLTAKQKSGQVYNKKISVVVEP